MAARRTTDLNGHELIEVPPGVAWIGACPLDRFAGDAERPAREVFVSRFLVSRFPTTIAQMARFFEESGRLPGRISAIRVQSLIDEASESPSKPATGVSWDLAVDYCKWLTHVSDRSFDLPTEVEWERSARGDDDRIWPWGNVWDAARCNSVEDGTNRIASVDAYPGGASPFHVEALSGGVWEWCVDAHHETAYSIMGSVDAVCLLPSTRRVVKGGSAFCAREVVRVSCRDWTNSVNQGGADDGFRVLTRVR